VEKPTKEKKIKIFSKKRIIPSSAYYNRGVWQEKRGNRFPKLERAG
jgi:hypothetical protein